MSQSSRPRRTLLFVGVVLVVFCALPFSRIKWTRFAAERAYQAQLTLARKEGIPTTPAEFEALIPRAEPHENAAIHYQKLDGLSFDYTTSSNLRFKLVREPTPEVLEQTKKFLESHKTSLDHLDAGTSLEKCWFEQDWSKRLVRETGVSTAYHAAHLLMLRGTLRMHRGDTRGALSDADRIDRMAAHYGVVLSPRAQDIRANLEDDVLEALSEWCYAVRPSAVFLEELKDRIDRYSENSDMGDVWASWVLDGATILDRVWTARGRKELGLKATTFQQNVGLAMAPADTNARIIEALRELTLAAKTADPDRTLRIEAARFRVREASKPLEGLMSVMPLELGDDLFEDRRLFHRALARAFEHREIPTSLDTSDLISPSTGKPITYAFDGFTIEVKGSSTHQFVVKPLPPPTRKP